MLIRGRPCGALFYWKNVATLILALLLFQYLFISIVVFNLSFRTTSSISSDLIHSKREIFLKKLTSSFLNNSNSTITLDLNLTLSNQDNATSTNILCPPMPPNLNGPVEVVQSPIPTIQELEDRFDWLISGGHYTPNECITRNKVAIIIPYRLREQQLLLFLQHMHPFLKKQQIEYTMFVIEQNGNYSFNKATLMNIGYKEALKSCDFQCVIFHDVDLMPENDRNLYTCPEKPRHMSVAVNTLGYKLPYLGLFGGVTAFTKEHFELVNGFSNSFWGWGGEDDDMTNRLHSHNLHIMRHPADIARYTMLNHIQEKISPIRFEILEEGKKKFDKDGLVNLKYKVVVYEAKLLYTWILVDIPAPVTSGHGERKPVVLPWKKHDLKHWKPWKAKPWKR